MRKQLQVLLLAAVSLLASSASWADRDGYSYLGIGFESVNYQEQTIIPNTGNPSLDGAILDTDYTGANFSQNAGGYVAVNNDWGFYINNNSTFGSQVHNEKWKLNGIEVQNDSMTLYRGDTNVWAARRLSGNHYLLFGGSYNRIDFKRFNFSLTTAGESLVENPGDTVIAEEVLEIIGQVGYEYNQFFNNEGEGFKTQLRALLGTPVYSQTRNSRVDNSNAFTSSFEGYGARASASVGYQFNQHFLIATTIELFYQHRNEDSRGTATGGVEILPERTISYVQPSLVAYWAF